MKTLIAILAIAFLSGFGGCTTTPKNAQEAVYTAEGTFNAALNVAIAYKNLPRCSDASGALCSDPAKVELLQHAAIAAQASLAAARKAVCTAETTVDGKRVCKSAFDESVVNNALVTMRTALEAFTGITQALKLK